MAILLYVLEGLDSLPFFWGRRRFVGDAERDAVLDDMSEIHHNRSAIGIVHRNGAHIVEDYGIRGVKV